MPSLSPQLLSGPVGGGKQVRDPGFGWSGPGCRARSWDRGPQLMLTTAPPAPLRHHFLRSRDTSTHPHPGGHLHQAFAGREAVLAPLCPHVLAHLEGAGWGLGENVRVPGGKQVSDLSSHEATSLPSPGSGRSLRDPGWGWRVSRLPCGVTQAARLSPWEPAGGTEGGEQPRAAGCSGRGAWRPGTGLGPFTVEGGGSSTSASSAPLVQSPSPWTPDCAEGSTPWGGLGLGVWAPGGLSDPGWPAGLGAPSRPRPHSERSRGLSGT